MKRRKLFYIPGLISIIGLPILLYFFGPDDIVRPTCARINLPTDKKDEPGILRFSKDGFYKLITHKRIVSVDLNEFASYFYLYEQTGLLEAQLHFISREMESLQFTHDTSTVLRVGFGDDNTYGQWMQVHEKALINRIGRHAFVDNSFYFMADPPPVHYEEQVLPYDPPIAIHVREQTKWEIFIRHVGYQWEEVLFVLKYNYVYVIGFILLILIPGIRLIARPRVQRLF